MKYKTRDKNMLKSFRGKKMKNKNKRKGKIKKLLVLNIKLVLRQSNDSPNC